MKIAFGVDSPICHYGVDRDSFRPLPEVRREDHILSVGELSPRKGFDFIVESVALIPAGSRPQLKLACNSIRPAEKTYLENLAAQRGVELCILTNLDTSRLAVEYNKASLCVYAPVLEPFGLVPVEAMSCGTPVVGVREGGVQESVVHDRTGLLVQRDPAKFAEAIQSLLSNPARAAEFGRNGRDHVLRNWTWESSVSQMEEYFRTCAGRMERG
jgi:glycosyltransferase involved in cell wall biosynthesis